MKTSFPILLLAVLLAGAVGGIAFGSGVLYGRNNAPAKAAAPAAAAVVPAAGDPNASPVAARGGGTPAAGGGRGAAGGGGGGTVGAVDSISGSILTVRTQQGTLQTVNLLPETRVVATSSVSTADLKPGTPVQVIGQPDAAGAINATAITLQQTTSPLPAVGTPGATPAAEGPSRIPVSPQNGQSGGQGRSRSSPTPAAP